MSTDQSYPFKILLKGTRATANEKSPAVVCDQEVICDLPAIREEVAASIGRALGGGGAKVAGRVRLLVRVIRRADNKKEDLKEICSIEELAERAAEVSFRVATALSRDPLVPVPGDVFQGAKDFAQAGVEQIRSAVEWIQPIASAPSPEAAVAATAATAAKKIARKAAGVASSASASADSGALPPNAQAQFANAITNVFKNLLSDPDLMQKAATIGKSVASSLPPIPTKT